MVYVLRMRNTLEFFYFNYAFLAHGLPLARFANGVRLLLVQPVGEVLRRLLGKSLAAERRGGAAPLHPRAAQLGALPAHPPFIIPPSDFEGPYLADAARAAARARIDPSCWCRSPSSGAGARSGPTQGPLSPLFDPLFGDQDEPRLFRRIWQVLRHARRSLAVVCEPLDLREFLAARAGRAAPALVEELDAELLRRIEAERAGAGSVRRAPIRSRSAPACSPRRPCARPSPARAAQTGLPLERVRRRAAGCSGRCRRA